MDDKKKLTEDELDQVAAGAGMKFDYVEWWGDDCPYHPFGLHFSDTFGGYCVCGITKKSWERSHETES